MEVKWYPKGLVPIRPNVEVVGRLAMWRRRFEAGAEASIQDADVNAALFLADVRAALELGPADRRKILGRAASANVERAENTPVAWAAEAKCESAKPSLVPTSGRPAR